jgi:peptidoglycan/LPS O-acetylase OafA/YrhL
MMPMFQFFVLWAIVFGLVRNRARGHVPAVNVMQKLTVVAALGSAAIYATSFPEEPLSYGGIWALPFVGWQISLGMIAYWVASGQLPAGRGAVVLGLCVLANVYLTATSGRYEGHVTWGYKAGLVYPVLVAVGRGLRFPRVLPVRLLARVGVWSYSIYLTHIIVLYRLFQILSAINPDSPAVVLASYWAAFAATIGAGYCFYRFVERPTIRWCESFRYRTTTGTSSKHDHTPPLGLVFSLPK